MIENQTPEDIEATWQEDDEYYAYLTSKENNRLGSDFAAWKFLKERGFTEKGFVIQIPKDRKLTKEELEAINYLTFEWDYSWEKV